jgi:valyl-tRNA synthetase
VPPEAHHHLNLYCLLQASIPSIMLAPYPAPNPAWACPEADAQFEFGQTVVNAIRKLRSDYGLTKQRPAVYITCSDAGRAAIVQQLAGDIATLCSSSEVVLLQGGAAAPAGCSVAIVDDATTVNMLLKVGGVGGDEGTGLELCKGGALGGGGYLGSLRCRCTLRWQAKEHLWASPISRDSTSSSCLMVPVCSQTLPLASPDVPVPLFLSLLAPVLQGILDPKLELGKLEKKLAEARARAEQLSAKIALPVYQEKTPEAIKADDADKLAKLHAEAAAAEQAIADMQKLLTA